jgi:F-type H+-transporting ATPase subunit gamma
MATAREIRRRIRSVKNIAQITRAMQMVATSRMRRAQERVLASRPYTEELRQMTGRLTRAASSDEKQTLMIERPVRNIGIILISPDRGLCGALPSNVNRKAAQVALEQRQAAGNGADVGFVAVGRRGRDFITRTRQPLIAEFTGLGDYPSIADTRAIARVAVDAYQDEQVDAVYLVYTQFISTLTQQPQAMRLLPVEPPPMEQGERARRDLYIYEPEPAEVLAALLPRYVETLVYQAILESIASEFSARMVAMKNATDNATELLDDLTLTYNKARQQAITTQILEVVAGAGG